MDIPKQCQLRRSRDRQRTKDAHQRPIGQLGRRPPPTLRRTARTGIPYTRATRLAGVITRRPPSIRPRQITTSRKITREAAARGSPKTRKPTPRPLNAGTFAASVVQTRTSADTTSATVEFTTTVMASAPFALALQAVTTAIRAGATAVIRTTARRRRRTACRPRRASFY